MSVKVIMPGVLTTVQDAGRFGYQKSGIRTAGVMDMESFEKANYLVGNEQGEAVLEAALYGCTMEFTEDTVIALTGADMEPKVNQMPVPMNRPIAIKTGDSLSLGMAKEGCRTYIAFAGGIDVPAVMGSRSTDIKCRIGGYQGRALSAGDEIKLGAGKRYEEVKDRRTQAVSYPALVSLRVIPGPQEEYFTEQGKKTFYSETYTISDQSDRMGYRLEGAAVESINGTDIVSDGIPLGAIQVPASGKPIILLADRQTTGGYAKIGTVCSFDIPKLVQAKPGDQVRFTTISAEEAQKMYEYPQKTGESRENR